jgi:hypothetical protein
MGGGRARRGIGGEVEGGEGGGRMCEQDWWVGEVDVGPPRAVTSM